MLKVIAEAHGRPFGRWGAAGGRLTLARQYTGLSKKAGRPQATPVIHTRRHPVQYGRFKARTTNRRAAFLPFFWQPPGARQLPSAGRCGNSDSSPTICSSDVLPAENVGQACSHRSSTPLPVDAWGSPLGHQDAHDHPERGESGLCMWPTTPQVGPGFPGAADCPERGGRTPSVRRPTIEGQGAALGEAELPNT